jgi:hypothetical protein
MADPDRGEERASAPAPQPGETAAREAGVGPAGAGAAAAADRLDPRSGGRPEREHRARSLAVASTAGLVLAATAFQNLWNLAGPLWEEDRRRGGILPIVVLGGVAALVAVAILLLIAWRLGRLVFSRRMTVSALGALALIFLLSLPFRHEGPEGAGSPAGLANLQAASDLFEPLLGESNAELAAEKVMVLARTAVLTDISGAWSVKALLGLLALVSLAGLIWRRPVGAREFGFMAAHAGLLLVLGGTAWGALFGFRRVNLQLGLDGVAYPVAGEKKDAPFRLVAREIIQEEARPEYRVLARIPGEGRTERLMLDGSRPGRTTWRGLEVEVLRFVPDAVAEEVVEDKGRRRDNPALRLELRTGGKSGKIVLYARSPESGDLIGRGLKLTYLRAPSAEEAARIAGMEPRGEPENLVVVSAARGVVDKVLLPFGRRKVGRTLTLAGIGLRLRVTRWFSGARVTNDGRVLQAPPLRRFPPAIEVVPLGPGGKTGGGLGRDPFWIVGGESPSVPVGQVPAALTGMRFAYNPPRWPPVEIRLVEGPEGSFRAAEVVDGRVGSSRPLAVGRELDFGGGTSVRLLGFMRGAQRSLRPAENPGDGRRRAAVQLAVSRGAVRETFWCFPRLSGACTVLGARISVRAVRRDLDREAVRLEVRPGSGEPENVLLERGRPYSRDGYSVYLTDVLVTGRRGGRVLGLTRCAVVRRPGLWAVWLGMALLALGVPWLLWTRFRQVPDPTEEL